MTLAPMNSQAGRRVLLAYGEEIGGPNWLRDVGAALGPSGFVLCQARNGLETIRWIESGGLAGAVLVEDQRAIEALSLMRIIRSIDGALPCWLLTDDLRRQTLETALSLRVLSVFSHSIGAGELADAVSRRLRFPGGIG